MGFCEFLFSRPLSKESFHGMLEVSGDYSPIEPKRQPTMNQQRRFLELFLYASQTYEPNWELVYKELQKLDSYDASMFTCRV